MSACATVLHGIRCGRPARDRVAGCVHEHVRAVSVCAEHEEHVTAGTVCCLPCQRLGHWCLVVLAPRRDRPARRTMMAEDACQNCGAYIETGPFCVMCDPGRDD